MSSDSKDKYVPVVKKTVVQSLSLQKQGDLKIENVKGLEEAFAIVVTDGGLTNTFTIHRPVGISGLDDDSWTATPASEVHYLLARADDPAQPNIDKTRGQTRNELLVTANLLILKDGKLHYPADVQNGAERIALLNAADAELKKMKQAKREEYKLNHPKANQDTINRKVKVTETRNDFLPDQAKVHEFKIQGYLRRPEIKEKIEGSCIQTYRTRGGPIANRPQRSIPLLKGLSQEKAVDAINQWLYTSLRIWVPKKETDNKPDVANTADTGEGGE